jgi:hypothetical protein
LAVSLKLKQFTINSFIHFVTPVGQKEACSEEMRQAWYVRVQTLRGGGFGRWYSFKTVFKKPRLKFEIVSRQSRIIKSRVSSE